MPKRTSLEERFWAKVRIADARSCWQWTGAGLSAEGRGYGLFAINRKGRVAHRVAYEMLVGPIPPGLTLDHLCRNRGCVNPAHLEPVTMRENLMRSDSPSAVNARKTHCKHGHELTPENTYNYGYRMCRICNYARCQRYRAAAKGARAA